MRLQSAAWRAVCVGLVVLLIAGCGTAEQRRARALQRGTEYLDAGNLPKARVEFRNALQLAPNDPEARYENGRVAERLGNPREAAQFYQGALDIAPDHARARADLARLFLFAGAAERAMDLVKPGLEKNPNDVGMLVVRASVRAQLKDQAGALEDAQRAYQLEPNNEQSIAVLAGLSVADGQYERAEQILATGARANPKSLDLRVALAELYVTRHDEPRAEQALRDVVQLKPDVAPFRIRLAQFLAAANKVDEAEAALRAGIAAQPKDASLKAALITFLTARRGRDAARTELEREIQADPDGVAPRFSLANFDAEQKDFAHAEAIYRDVIRRHDVEPDGLSARTRLAVLRLQQNDLAGAESLLGEVLKANPRDNDALVVRGELLLGKGDPKAAIADLRAVLRDQPNSLSIMRVLARAHILNGEPALAEETLRHGMEIDVRDPGVRLDLADLLLQSAKPEQSAALLAPLAKERPQDLPVQRTMFRAALAAKDIAGAKLAVRALQAADPKGVVGYVDEGLVAEDERRTDDAIRAYEHALQLQPEAPEPLTAVVRLLVASKRAPEALRRLDAAAARSPTSVVPLMIKADLLVSEKKFAEAEATLQAALARAPRSWLPYRALAATATAKGESARALSILQEGMQRVEDPKPLQLELAQLLDRLGRGDDAIAQYEELVKREPASAAYANNLAMLLVTYRHDAASLKRAGELTARFATSANPLYLDTYGWVRLKQGDAAGAMSTLDQAVAGSPQTPTLRYHLAMAQLGAGQRDAARRTLGELLAANQQFPEQREAREALAKLSQPM